MTLRDRLAAALAERYTLVRELGRGGMAVVFLAQDRKHGRAVAIKVLRPELSTSVGAERFLLEIQIAATLQHPHIVPLYDSGQAGDLLYYVMPHVEGETLRDYLYRQAQLTLDETLAIVRDVAEALSYAHAHGVVHRDIKPENILLSGGHALVSDFGVARALSEAGAGRLTDAGLAVGTPSYMSPEQGAGHPTIDGRADLYALGCVLFEMLTGEPPFTGRTAQSIIARHLNERVPSLRIVRPGLPPVIERVARRALEKVPADRFQNAAELAAALPTGEMRGWAVGLRLPRRWPVGAALVVVALAAAVVGLRDRPAAASGVGVVIVPLDAAPGGNGTSPAALDQLLRNALEWLPGVRTIDGRELVGDAQSWRAVPLEELLAGAGRRGGKYLVTGAHLPLTEGPVVDIGIRAVPSGVSVFRGRAEAREESLERALDRLAIEALSTLVAQEHVDIGVPVSLLMSTSSALALGGLLQARTRFWTGDLEGAAAALRQAIARDPDFPLAYQRLSVAEVYLHRDSAALAAVDAGLARRARFGPNWNELLAAQRYYVLGFGDSAVGAFQSTVRDEPENIDGWFGLGESLFHFAGLAGHPAREARVPLERVAALDSTFAPIYAHLADLAIHANDAPAARRAVARMRPDDPQRPARELAVALRFGSPRERAVALGGARAAARFTLSELVMILTHGALDLPLADTIAALLLLPGRTQDDQLRGRQYRFVILTALGRPEEALAVSRASHPASAFDRWVVEAYLAGYPVERVAAPMIAWARDRVNRGAAPDFTVPWWDEGRQAFRGLVHDVARRGGAADVQSLLARLNQAAVHADPADPEPHVLRAALEARLALLAADTTRALAALERSVARVAEARIQFFPLTTMASERLQLGVLYHTRGDTTRARRWLDTFEQSWSIGDLLYVRAAATVRSSSFR